MSDPRSTSELHPAGTYARDIAPDMAGRQVEAGVSGVSWGAIFAGAAGAAALSLILLLLGSGLGFSSISPWAERGASATAIGVATICWLTFTQLAASGLGGYLAGRLRTKWAGIHGDEVYFRDTAHGFLAWAVATLLTASVLSSAVGTVIGAGAQAGAAVAGGAATTAAGVAATGAAASATTTERNDSSPGPMAYFVDTLFRPGPGAGAAPAESQPGAATPAPAGTPTDTNRSQASMAPEVARIFANGMRAGALAPEDAKYVGTLVAQRTGLSQADAEKRVNEVFAKAQATANDAKTKAQQAADAARKAAAYASLWLVVSLLIGAFVASFAAIHGGKRRDF